MSGSGCYSVFNGFYVQYTAPSGTSKEGVPVPETTVGRAVTELRDIPFFDARRFAVVHREVRAGFPSPAELSALWESLLPYASLRHIHAGGGLLSAALGVEAERRVDALWAVSPFSAYILDALAGFMCRELIRGRMPEVEKAGCMPLPEPSADVAAALEAAGMPCRNVGTTCPARRYALLTRYPYRGGCPVCALRGNCPGQAGANTERNSLTSLSSSLQSVKSPSASSPILAQATTGCGETIISPLVPYPKACESMFAVGRITSATEHSGGGT
jgi:hypothetical protein